MVKELICISCPMGCHLSVDAEKLTVTGNTCKRGETYGINEITNPVRVITTTVKVEGGLHAVLPVKTNAPIPKNLNFKCIEEINKITSKAPIKMGEVIVENILNTGVDVVACRDLD
jgi:CxxC motif-containing protein